MARVVDNEVPSVSHWLANGDILHTFAWSNAVVRGVVRTFGRSVHIDDFYVVTVDTIQLFTTCRDETYGQVVIGIEQQGCDGC